MLDVYGHVAPCEVKEYYVALYAEHGDLCSWKFLFNENGPGILFLFIVETPWKSLRGFYTDTSQYSCGTG